VYNRLQDTRKHLKHMSVPPPQPTDGVGTEGEGIDWYIVVAVTGLPPRRT
jgi:hypothetical protein